MRMNINRYSRCFDIIILPRETPITTGMSLTAEIRVNKRRIIEFFIYPMIKYWNQAIQVR